MSALVHHAVQDQKLAGDPEVLRILAADSLRAASRSKIAADALRQIVDAADGQFQIGLAKGVAFDLSLYAGRAVREFADLDIFLNRQELFRFGEILRTLGDVEVDVALVNRIASSGRTYEHAVRVGSIWVDVHNDIMNFVLPIRQHDLFWSRLIPIEEISAKPDQWAGKVSSAGRATVLLLDAELMVIQALANYARDLFTDLRHLNDFRVMFEGDIDWDFVASFAEAEGWYDLVASSLDVVCSYLEVPSPLPIRSKSAHMLATQVLWPERHRLRGRSRIGGVRTGQARASLLISGRRAELVREIYRRIIPPKELLDLLDYPAPGPRVWRVLRYRWNQTKTLSANRKALAR